MMDEERPSVRRIFRMVDGSKYEVEAKTERDAIDHVERVFGKKTWTAIEIIPQSERGDSNG